MKRVASRIALAFLAVAMLIGSASAQSFGTTDEYALSEEVTAYDISGQQLVEFTNLVDEDVTIEVLNNGEVVTTVDKTVNSNGLVAFDAGTETVTVDQLAVYPAESAPSDVSSVTHYYDFTSGDEFTSTNYNASQAYTSFTIEESESNYTSIIGLIAVLGVIGAFMNKM